MLLVSLFLTCFIDKHTCVSSSLCLSCCTSLSFCSISFCTQRAHMEEELSSPLQYTLEVLLLFTEFAKALQESMWYLALSPEPDTLLQLPLQLRLPHSFKTKHMRLPRAVLNTIIHCLTIQYISPPYLGLLCKCITTTDYSFPM